jgi:hypothetical protein
MSQFVFTSRYIGKLVLRASRECVSVSFIAKTAKMSCILFYFEDIPTTFCSRSTRNFELKFDRENPANVPICVYVKESRQNLSYSANVPIRVYVKVSRQFVSWRLAPKYKCKFDRSNFANVMHGILLEGIRMQICLCDS